MAALLMLELQPLGSAYRTPSNPRRTESGIQNGVAVMASISDLKSWISNLRYAKWERDVFVANETDDEIKLWLYSDTNLYAIDASNPSEERPLGYLGCVVSSRKPRAGETWTRGNDLSDGQLTIETWHRILGDIVSFEMVKVHQHASLVDAEQAPGGRVIASLPSATGSNAAN
jgi:hypothetical protein